ncbi:MAG: signal peptidase I, partial [Verrucomicrobiae bacterium]|nr:signal peptidase I [Verrucomicrobiae bacterium]
GSMQPTLYGVHLDPLPKDRKIPILPIRALEWALFGRSYIDVICEEDGELWGVREGRVRSIGPFTFPQAALILRTRSGDERDYPVSVDHRTLENQLETRLGIKPRTVFRAGEPLLRCTVSSGDHIFVDKVSYNFRRPRRGEVFVFETKGIVGTQGEFYIKRLAGLPGDELQIREPELWVNGALAQEPGFVRVMSRTNGYKGYSNTAGYRYLSAPDQKIVLGKDEYFALGDNSYHSSDSRYWGTVPHRNLVGRALWVYWPFTKRFGLTD